MTGATFVAIGLASSSPILEFISDYYLASHSIAYFSWSNEYYKLNKLLRSNGKSILIYYPIS